MPSLNTKTKYFNAKRIATLSVLCAMGLIMFMVESLFPPLFLPGAKMGLSNIFSLLTLYLLGPVDALIVVVGRTVLGSMFGGGMWCPNKDLLHAVRREILANYEEVEDIFANPVTNKYFKDFDTEYMLKKVPQGFPADFVHADWLKRKCYTFGTPLTNEQVCAPDFVDLATEIAYAAKPINDFLNYTFEEYGEFPDR